MGLPCAQHDVPVHLLGSTDAAPSGEHFLPGARRRQPVLLKEVFAIEEELRVADIGQRQEFSGGVGMAAERQRRRQEIGVGSVEIFGAVERLELAQTVHLREAREPGVVEHHQVIRRSRPAKADEQLLEERLVRVFDDFHAHAELLLVVARGLLQPFGLDAGVHRQQQRALRGGFFARAAGRQERQQ